MEPGLFAPPGSSPGTSRMTHGRSTRSINTATGTSARAARPAPCPCVAGGCARPPGGAPCRAAARLAAHFASATVTNESPATTSYSTNLWQVFNRTVVSQTVYTPAVRLENIIEVEPPLKRKNHEVIYQKLTCRPDGGSRIGRKLYVGDVWRGILRAGRHTTIADDFARLAESPPPRGQRLRGDDGAQLMTCARPFQDVAEPTGRPKHVQVAFSFCLSPGCGLVSR